MSLEAKNNDRLKTAMLAKDEKSITQPASY
jgi:hypothetical protein